MNELQLVQEHSYWIWVNNWQRDQPMSPKFNSFSDAQRWHQEISQCFAPRTHPRSKLPKLCQAQSFGQIN
jgi:hypothetical protein